MSLDDRGLASSPGHLTPSGAQPPRRGRLFKKYVALFVVVVLAALGASGAFQVWFAYKEQTDAIARNQKDQADAAAAKITQFIREIEGQMGWTTQLPWSNGVNDQRRVDALRLLRQVPAITELSQIDSNGREQLRVSRLAMDVIGSGIDLSKDPKFTEAIANRIYYGPVYFRRESEPYMTLSLAGSRRDSGVSASEVNLKFIWDDVISKIRVGKTGHAYVVDGGGRLIAHPDISLVLRITDFTNLPQVRAARGDAGANDAPPRDLEGRQVISSSARIPALGWTVVIDLPLEEALAPLYETLIRLLFFMILGVAISFLAGLFLARRMIVPIRALQAGAAEIGAGNFDRRITVKTGDEIEMLADQFNEMADQLKESHSDLEHKIEERTQQLALSVRELTALGDIGKALNSTLDLEQLLTTIVAKAVELSNTESGGIYVFDDVSQEFHLRATFGTSSAFVDKLNELRIRVGETPVGEAASRGEPLQIDDLSMLPQGPVRRILESDGFRALLIVPLVLTGEVIGALVVRRRDVGAFSDDTVRLLQTFAAQSVLAIQNARLFTELAMKSRQLELASQHKSQFLANMSHELRTPLNAIIGYTELIIDQTYGSIPERAMTALDRVQINGKHLLGLINDVLDLSKIEAGQLTLSIAEYAPQSIVEVVASTMASLAQSKGLQIHTNIGEILQRGVADERRITQVLLNLVGNAIKFTDTGYVNIKLTQNKDRFEFEVHDTGPGISAENQSRIFDEFQQIDDSSTRTKGGTGLGLTISKRIVEMHGGTISVQSAPGQGATFNVIIPVICIKGREAA